MIYDIGRPEAPNDTLKMCPEASADVLFTVVSNLTMMSLWTNQQKKQTSELMKSCIVRTAKREKGDKEFDPPKRRLDISRF